jgi:uncharacterized membrane protein
MPTDGHLHPANVARHDERSLGDHVADGMASGMGSWAFIICQAAFTIAWIILNSVHGWHLMWDAYPWVLLNLVYSFQAGFTGPILLLSQNRQAEHDRLRAEEDYVTNGLSLKLNRVTVQHLEDIKQHFGISNNTEETA